MNEQSMGDKNVSQHVTEGRDIKTITELPWWLSGKESACQSRRHRFDPWSGKIPHTVEQLGPRATLLSLCSRAREPRRLELARPGACTQQREKPPMRSLLTPTWEWLLLAATRKKSMQWRPSTAQNNVQLKKKKDNYIRGKNLQHQTIPAKSLKILRNHNLTEVFAGKGLIN